MRVVLPAPLGPMTAWISPLRTSSDTSDTARRPPNRFPRLIATRAASGMAGFGRGRRSLRTPPRVSRRRASGQSDHHVDELPHAAGEGEHDGDDDEAFDELPMLGH